MKKLVYFRKLYEREKELGALEKLKEYVYGNNAHVVKGMCAGDVFLPSPFLLDELEWSVNVQDYYVRSIIYDLKISSRAFYSSLLSFQPGEYRRHFEHVSSLLGQKIICGLEDLRAAQEISVDWVAQFLQKCALIMRGFAFDYPECFKTGIYGCGVALSAASSIGISVLMGVSDISTELVLSAILASAGFMGVMRIEDKIYVFRKTNILGQNLLAIRYKDFVSKITRDNNLLAI